MMQPQPAPEAPQGAPAPEGGGEAEKIMGMVTKAKDNAQALLDGIGDSAPPEATEGLGMVVQGWDMFLSSFGGGQKAPAPMPGQQDMAGGNPNAKPVA